jgi:putative ABC transport system ATP-binding protein
VDTGVQVLHVIRELNKREASTVVLVTHNSAIAPAADSVIRLRNGMIERQEKNDKPRSIGEIVW